LKGGDVQQLCDLKETIYGQGRLSRFQFGIGILGYTQFISHEVLGIFPQPSEAVDILQH
jgi:hypothetical protein